MLATIRSRSNDSASTAAALPPVSAQQLVAELLSAWKNDYFAATEVLAPLVYESLRRIALVHLAHDRPAAMLQAAARLQEAYARLATQSLPNRESRSRFLRAAAHLMRQILVEHARRRQSARRGGIAEQRTGTCAETIALDRALTALGKVDETKCRLIELRSFGGLSVEQAAEAMGIPIAAAARELLLAEAWLQCEFARLAASQAKAIEIA